MGEPTVRPRMRLRADGTLETVPGRYTVNRNPYRLRNRPVGGTRMSGEARKERDEEIYQLGESGIGPEEIAEGFGLSEPYVRAILRNKWEQHNA